MKSRKRRLSPVINSIAPSLPAAELAALWLEAEAVDGETKAGAAVPAELAE